MAKKKPTTKAGKQRKIKTVLGEFKSKTLKSSSGKKVKSKAQALAIALSEAGQSKKRRKK